MAEYIVILVTAEHENQAQEIAQALLKEKLIACANIVDHVHSMFFWKNKLDQAQETMMILKTRADLFNRVRDCILALHSYNVPEIIALPIIASHDPYLKWIDESVS